MALSCGYDEAVIRIGVRELKDGLSRALRLVQSGESVDVTDQGRPTARFVKAWPSRARQLIAEGRLMPPEIGDDLLDPWPPPPLHSGERLGSDLLAELRADER